MQMSPELGTWKVIAYHDPQRNRGQMKFSARKVLGKAFGWLMKKRTQKDMKKTQKLIK